MEIAHLLDERQAALAQGQSERAFCRDAPIARSTLRDHVQAQRHVEAAPEVAAFFGSPQGRLALLRMVLAAHFVMTLLGCCGIEAVCTLLRLAGLGPFVATSFGAQHRVNTVLQQQVAAFSHAEKTRLGATMPAKTIGLCEDETFFPQMVLVAIEAVSGFVLVERHAERRDAATWTTVVGEALTGLPVQVEGVTADQAKGILAHATQHLGVEVTPDVFHVQHALGKVTAAALARRVRTLQEEQDKRQPKGDDATAVAEPLSAARAQQQGMAAAIEGLGEACRPYDEQTGEVRYGDLVKAELHEILDKADAMAKEANLSETSHKAIAKARRVIPAMAASIEGFHQRVNENLAALHLPEDIERAMRHQVLPALYLERVAQQSRDGATKQALHARARALVAPLQQESSPLMQLSEAAVAALLDQGTGWVALYQRSSSCVEGRNGQLALHHHSLHSLTPLKLQALTAVRNFWVQREDGSTAAERFFEQKPQDLFEWLLDVMPDLPTPAQKRPRPPPSPLLN